MDTDAPQGLVLGDVAEGGKLPLGADGVVDAQAGVDDPQALQHRPVLAAERHLIGHAGQPDGLSQGSGKGGLAAAGAPLHVH